MQRADDLAERISSSPSRGSLQHTVSAILQASRQARDWSQVKENRDSNCKIALLKELYHKLYDAIVIISVLVLEAVLP
jgi:hypothetical protein